MVWSSVTSFKDFSLRYLTYNQSSGLTFFFGALIASNSFLYCSKGTGLATLEAVAAVL